MRLMPSEKRDWLLLALVAASLWLPIAILLLIGMQSATPRDPKTVTIKTVVAIVTVGLLWIAVVGIRRIGLRRKWPNTWPAITRHYPTYRY
jgi:uncharacterized membrane protein